MTWEKYLAVHNTVALKDKVDDKVMHENLMDMAAEYAAGKIPAADIDGRIKDSFDKYVGDNKDVAQKQ